MAIILKIDKETFDKFYFELPQIVVYSGKTVGEFNMSSPSGLIRALNAKGQKLHELFLNKEEFSANWESARIERKKIVVEKHSSKSQRDLEAEVLREKIQEEKRRAKSKRLCAICGETCEKSKKMIGTCSEECRKIKLFQRNESVKNNHWCKSENYQTIKEKRLRTRKSNDDLLDRSYCPWNKGKTGIYSPETIEKIRNSTRQQFHREVFKKTKIEKKIDELLRELGVNFKYSFILDGRQYDFLLRDQNTVLEIQGDFWHGNPLFWGEGKRPLRDHQIMKRLDDSIKKRIATSHGYNYFEIWEHDIHNNWQSCAAKIEEIIRGNH